MCTVCGCGEGEVRLEGGVDGAANQATHETHEHEHTHADGTVHRHAHGPAHALAYKPGAHTHSHRHADGSTHSHGMSIAASMHTRMKPRLVAISITVPARPGRMCRA
jgi:hypothetical protein